ncbi:MAG TPA: hypothetical protein VFI42_11960 [Thermomicrobiaceae bacterium]|nr:hypothetical protein [Thermomicrobiaceae bacterium]
MVFERDNRSGKQPGNQPKFFDADYAPPGATNILNHGWDVVDDTGQHIGKVDQIYDNYFSIAEGYLIHKLVYAPFSAIARVDLQDNEVTLNVSQQQIEALGWDRIPEDVGFGTADNYVVGPTGEIYPNETPQEVERRLHAEGAPGASRQGTASGQRAADQQRTPRGQGAAEPPEAVEVTIVEEVIELGPPESEGEAGGKPGTRRG